VSAPEYPIGQAHGSPLDVLPLATDAAVVNGAGSTAANGASSTAAAPAVAAPAIAASASATCVGCGAPLAPDQRYCLACGRAASPVRLAFLDVLQGEHRSAALGSEGAGAPGGLQPVISYALPPEPDGLLGTLRRYSGLLALTGVLLASLLIGLLVGHWITGGGGASAGAGKQVIEVKLPNGALAAAPATSTTGESGSAAGEGSAGHASQSHSSAKEEAKEEAKEAKEVTAAKAPPVVHKKTSSQSLQKLNKTTGEQHAKEVNELIKGDEPIETGH
jgi:hypothetical protein